MSTVYPSRKTPPPDVAPFTPPLTPPQSKAAALGAETPADMNVPDNYVDYTLKTTKALPPVTWENWWKEINYISLAVLTVTPLIAAYGAFTTKLRWETAAFAVFYYFVTGLGTFFVHRASGLCPQLIKRHSFRYHCGLPSFLGASVIQRVQAFAVLPCRRRCWRRGGLHQVVVSGPPRPPSVHRHRT